MPVNSPGMRGATIDFEVVNAKETAEALGKLRMTAQEAISTYLGGLATVGANYIRDETPRGDTWKLAMSTISQSRGRNKYIVGQTAQTEGRNKKIFYGRVVRMGSQKPTRNSGVIMPNKAKALYWGPKKNSRGLDHPIMFVGKVGELRITQDHPGVTKPNDYVGRAVQRMRPNINSVARTIGMSATTKAFSATRTGKVK